MLASAELSVIVSAPAAPVWLIALKAAPVISAAAVGQLEQSVCPVPLTGFPVPAKAEVAPQLLETMSANANAESAPGVTLSLNTNVIVATEEYWLLVMTVPVVLAMAVMTTLGYAVRVYVV